MFAIGRFCYFSKACIVDLMNRLIVDLLNRLIVEWMILIQPIFISATT